MFGHTYTINDLVVVEDTLISASGDGNLKLWDLATGVCLKTVLAHAEGVYSLAQCTNQEDNITLASGGSGDTSCLTMWSLSL